MAIKKRHKKPASLDDKSNVKMTPKEQENFKKFMDKKRSKRS